MATELIPLGDLISIRPDEEPTVVNGIILPEARRKERPSSGIIVACPRTGDWLRPGLRVFYPSWAGTTYVVSGRTRTLIAQSEILAFMPDPLQGERLVGRVPAEWRENVLVPPGWVHLIRDELTAKAGGMLEIPLSYRQRRGMVTATIAAVGDSGFLQPGQRVIVSSALATTIRFGVCGEHVVYIARPSQILALLLDEEEGEKIRPETVAFGQPGTSELEDSMLVGADGAESVHPPE